MKLNKKVEKQIRSIKKIEKSKLNYLRLLLNFLIVIFTFKNYFKIIE